MRLPAAAETTVTRACALLSRERLGPDGKAALALLRALRHIRPAVSSGEQLVLRATLRATPVPGCRLGADGVTALICAARQIADRMQAGEGPAKKRSSRAKRGTASDMVVCRHCPVGKPYLALLGDDPVAKEMAQKAPRSSDTSTT